MTTKEEDFDYNRRILGLDKSIKQRKQWSNLAEYPGGVIQRKEKFVPFHRIVYRVIDSEFGKSRTLDSLKDAESWIDKRHGKSSMPLGVSKMESLP